jgi:hypothetical protein
MNALPDCSYRSPDTPSFLEYRKLSPAEQTVADCEYWKEFTDPKHRRFLVGLFRMVLETEDSHDEAPVASEALRPSLHCSVKL